MINETCYVTGDSAVAAILRLFFSCNFVSTSPPYTKLIFLPSRGTRSAQSKSFNGIARVN